MEGMPCKTTKNFPPIPFVPQDGVTDDAEMLPDLMHPSGERSHCDKSGTGTLE